VVKRRSKKDSFKKPLVNSCLTLAIVTGQSVMDLSQNVFANLGWDEVRLPNPVYEGDTLYARSEVLEMRESKSRPDEIVVVAMNFTPLPRHNYQIGLPRRGHWREVLNSDAPLYGGSGQGNMGGVDATPIPRHGRRWSAHITLPPLGAVFLLSTTEESEESEEPES
jgi:hypothetical protein